MTLLFKSLDNLPQPPGDFLDSLLQQWIDRYGCFTKTGSFPDINLELIDKVKTRPIQRFSTFDPVSRNINDWLVTNIYKPKRSYADWVLRFTYVHMSNQNRPPWQRFEMYAKHVDSKYQDPTRQHNNYVLIFNITDSVGDFVVYKQQKKPLIIKDERPFYKEPTGTLHQLPHEHLIFTNCIEVARFTPMPRSWYLTRNDVIHAVENCNAVPRVALQIRLTEKEAQTLL